MAYILWGFIGFLVSTLLGAGPLRRTYRQGAGGSALASMFGAITGGIIGDGVPHALSGEITLSSIVGAVIGALLFCWALHSRQSDVEP